MSYAALCNHGFDLSVEGGGEHVAERHLKGRAGGDDAGVEEDLVGFAEGEVELVLLHEFAVLLRAFAAHDGRML